MKVYVERRDFIALAILLACCGRAHALNPALDINQYAHSAWTAREGLRGSTRSIVQTPDGYLWLGTEFGLARFDGVRFVSWIPPGQHLPSTNIRSLLAARDGTLWIGTVEGLASWKDGKLRPYAEVAGQNVLTLFEDHEGTVWAGTFGTPNGKLCAIQRTGVKCYGTDGSFGQWVYTVYEENGQLWVHTGTGVWRWKPGPPKRYHVRLPGSYQSSHTLVQGDNRAGLVAIANGKIRQIVDENVLDYPLSPADSQFTALNLLRDRDGGLWIGTLDRGVLRVHNGKTSAFSQSDGLSGDRVLSLFEDREANIWVGTADGLDCFREFAVTSISVKQGLSSPGIMAVLAAHDNTVWVSALDGLNRWNNGQITIYRPRRKAGRERSRFGATPPTIPVTEIADPELPDEEVGSLFEDERGRIWVSTPAGISRFEGDRFHRVTYLPGGWVNTVVSDGNGGLWISYQDHGLIHVANEKVVERIPWSKFGGNVVASALVADSINGGLWLGFFQGGLVYFKDGQVRASYGKNEGLGSGRVMRIQLHADGTLWAATEGGVSRVSVRDARVATLTSSNGLPCDTVHWAVEDGASSVWLYTACGLLRVPSMDLEAWASNPAHKIRYTLFDTSEGVKSHALLTGYTPRVSKSPDGKLWFAHIESVSMIDSHHLAVNKLPPPVHIEQITVDGKTHDAVHDLRLPSRVSNVTIRYTALSLVAPEKVHFRFKLEGQDSDWREVVNERVVQYSNLGPGPYRFRVIASNNSGVWNEAGDTLEFSIDPAYYQTTWFRALVAAAFLTLLWAAYQQRVRHLRREETKLRDVIETIPTIAWTALPDGSVDFINRRWHEYTGLSVQKTAGSGWESVVHASDLQRYVEKWRASVATGEPFDNEVRFRRASDGQYRWFLTRAVALRDARGKILKWFGISTEIEDRKLAEQERETLRADLAHVNRVTMLGELAASLSHELKQPIAAAMTNARTALRWLKRERPDVEEACEAANRIVNAGTRSVEIIDRLRSLYKKSPPKRELVDVNESIRDMVVLLRSEANRYAVSVRTDLAADLPQITADRVQLQQVLMNLMLNAIEAMKETGGVLTVKSHLGDNGQLLISVSDTGVGLPAEKADEIFNAFVTTKPQGSGMGLAISRSIIESHRGRLWATANDGRGATFHFSLPITPEAHAGAEHVAANTDLSE